MHDNDPDLEYFNQILHHRNTLNEREVHEWLSREENRELIDRSALMNRVLDSRSFAGLKSAEYARLHGRISGRRTRLTRWVSIAASVLVVISFFLLTKDRTNRQEEAVTVITPGGYKAELVTADGNTIHLSRESREIKGDGVAMILNDSIDGLVYSSGEVADSSTPVQYNTLKVPPGGFYPLVLSDGTKVWLNAMSELRYPLVFSQEERAVYLKGEGYFEVKKDSLSPFTVHLESSRVTVLGTSFNISAYPEDRKIYTTLVSGSVLFVSEQTGKNVVLKPGHQSEMDLLSGGLSLKEVDTDVSTAWKDGVFYFKDMTLGEIMRIVSRWYQVEVVYMNSLLKETRYNGKMPMYSGISDVLRKIELSGEARFEINEHRITVFEK